MQFGIVILMILVAVVALIKGLATDLIGSIGAVLLGLLVLGLLASHTPRGCIQKKVCYYETAQVAAA